MSFCEKAFSSITKWMSSKIRYLSVDHWAIEGIDRRLKHVKICQSSIAAKAHECYESRLKGLSQETTLVLSNTRELDRVPNTK